MTPTDPHAPVTFSDPMLRCVFARLGVVDVGAIVMNEGGRCFWRVMLPGMNQRLRPANSMLQAKTDLVGCVRQWVEAASLQPTPARVDPFEGLARRAELRRAASA